MAIYMMRENTLTETYTVPTASTRQAIWKSGYKITKVVMNFACGWSSSASNNNIAFMKLYDKNPSNQTVSYDIGGSLIFWGERNNSGYGQFYRDNPSTATFVSFPSSATSTSQGAYCITLNYDWTWNVKVWQVYGTWLYDNNFTLTSAQITWIQGVFNSLDAVVSKTLGSNTWATKNEIEVTYESV